MREARRYGPALVLALGATLLGAVRQDQTALPPRQPLASLPGSFEDFVGRDLVISEQEQRIAGMSEYMMRQYTRDSTSTFSVYVGYYAYQLQGRTIHSPKNCLPGAGWQALGTGTELIEVGGIAHRVNRYLLTNGTEQALVYYWYQGRGRIAANEFAVKWDLLRDASLRGRSEEALVRIVIPLIRQTDNRVAPEVIEGADRLAADISARLIPRVAEVLPDWEFGRGPTVVSSAGWEALH